MKRICHLSSAHVGLDVRIFLKECVSLAEAGYETHIVINATPEDVAKAAAKGIHIHPLARPESRVERMCTHAWRCYRIAARLDAHVYHFHDAELIPYGILLSLVGKEVIYDSHEHLPRSILSKHWIPGWARRLVAGATAAIEYVGAKLFFSVVAATPFIAERFQRITPRAININNYPLPNEFASVATGERKQQVCYLGGISRIRGLKPVIEALPLVPHVKFVLCGQFSDATYEAELRALPGWKQVEYLGQVDRTRLRGVMGESMAGIVTFLPEPNHVDAQPNKLFEYMSASLPVIASDFPLWRLLIAGVGAGLCVDPESPMAIAEAIHALTSDAQGAQRMGDAGRDAVLNRYNWPVEAARLVSFYEGLGWNAAPDARGLEVRGPNT
ncbi:Glycosyl transferases group 1 [compost metagenome]